MSISGGDVLADTVAALSKRAPAIIAAAARELGEIRLHLVFGDGTASLMQARQSTLDVIPAQDEDVGDVEVHFDRRTLNLLFDAAQRPSEQALERSLDMRGTREDLLAVWRCFKLLSQRASGLRSVQAIWSAYRDQTRALWSGAAEQVPVTRARGAAYWDHAGWPALDWLDRRHPAQQEMLARDEPVLAPARSLWNGREAESWQATRDIFDNDLMVTMDRCKKLVVDDILSIIPKKPPQKDLYALMTDYVQREGKGLRPTLVIATCLALGGRLDDAVRAASALEMFHNGFLVHDDIADESTHRRGLPTLHEAHGIGLAVNTGDAMHLFAVDMALSNLATIGLARTLGIIHEILHMCRETVEGQAVELGWIRRNFVPSRDADYSRMSTKKTGWYTCMSPCRIGAVAAGVTEPALLDRLNEPLRLTGIAFQIQDDILNLIGETEVYGKEALGDLLEGKRTVMMIHLFRECDNATRKRMTEINALPRLEKPFDYALEMLAAMQKEDSIAYSIAHADRLANAGVKKFEADLKWIPETPGKAVLRQVSNYVTTRAL
ncbi:polyprenyl synthetase family protein [uncultured Roseobacter sp.]|uniref:polyprenyl synthetase family protein n=1 Tax=uncultured Roseobacter sp. TaxID=114847 RepID=UPI00262F84D5|nr:polyprenyl synthetase family protein [uncultured Roseobacter sp.]